ncbi:MAG: AAA family ATPase [Bacteroidetes bacterium]|nr:AAA family ATPase [Bacteroidota bacterium]
MVQRKKLREKIEKAIKRSVITTILGPRQCGKTTISRMIGANHHATFFDLEDPVSFQALKSSPEQLLSEQKGLIVLDEIQRMPELFPILRVLSDRTDSSARFLLLGSSSPFLMKHVSESLAF